MKTCFIVSIGILIVIGYGCGKSASADGPSKAVSAGNTTAVSHKMDEKKKEEHFIPATQGSKQQDELSEIESSLSQNHIDEATSLLINYYEKKKASKEDQSTTSANFIRLGDINWKTTMVTSKVFSSLEDKATQIERDNPGDPVALTNAIKVWKQYESLWNVADNKSPICKSRAEEIERSIKRMMEKQEKDLIQQKETQELSAAIDGLVRDCKQVETLCKEISDRYSLCAQRLANKILMAKRHHEEFLGKLKAWKGPLVRSHPIGDVPPQTKCVTIADLQDLIQQCCAETSSKIPDIQKLAVIEKEGAFREEVMGFDSEKLSHMVSPFIQAQNKIALDGDIIIRDLAVDLELVKNKCFLDRHKSDF